MSEKRKKWLIALGYVAFIFATLSVVRTPVSYLRSLGLLRLSLGILYGLFFCALFYSLYRSRPYEKIRFLFLTLLGFMYLIASRWTTTPEEQIHFFQYGLVGVFFLRALQLHKFSPIKNFLFALLLASLSGWLDEILQGWLPNRHYDVRDIALNFLSAFLGLVTYQIVFPASKDESKE